jgi:hypothetical protein
MGLEVAKITTYGVIDDNGNCKIIFETYEEARGFIDNLESEK